MFDKINLILLLAIVIGGIGFSVLAWRFVFRPAEPETKFPCPGCGGEGHLLRQELTAKDFVRLHYHCPCGNVWPRLWQPQLARSSEFKPTAN